MIIRNYTCRVSPDIADIITRFESLRGVKGAVQARRCVSNIIVEIRRRRDIVVILIIFEGPLFLRKLQLAQVIYAHVFPDPVPRRGKIRDGERGQYAYYDNHYHNLDYSKTF